MKNFRKVFSSLMVVLLLVMAVPVYASAAAKETGPFLIYFETFGGTGIPITATTNANGKLTELPTPKMDGYTFDGWFTDPVEGAKVSVTTTYTEETTLYAHWTPKAGTSGSTKPVDPEAPVKAFDIRDHIGTIVAGGTVLLVLILAASSL